MVLIVATCGELSFDMGFAIDPTLKDIIRITKLLLAHLQLILVSVMLDPNNNVRTSQVKHCG